MEEINIMERKILRELCVNSRIPLSEISKKFGIPRYLASKYIKDLEKKLGLHYTLELYPEALGVTTIHTIRIKFQKMPSEAYILESLKDSRIAQFVAITEGDFDLLIFAIARSTKEYAQWELAIQLKFAEYGIYLRPSEVTITRLGFVPFDRSLIATSSIEDVYKKIIEVLNENSRISVRDLSKRIGMKESITRYYFLNLKKMELVKRFTTIITNPPLKSNMAYFESHSIKPGIMERILTERKAVYFKQGPEIDLVNRLQVMWSITGSDQTFTIVSYSDEKTAIKESIDFHKEVFKKDQPVILYGFIKKVVKGYLPIRNLDVEKYFDTSAWPTELI